MTMVGAGANRCGVVRFLAVALSALFLTIAPTLASGPKVVATIKPVHSLVAGVMEGVGEPHLIVKGAGSPHGFNLRPSDAAALQGAEVVFRIGEDFEASLSGAIRKLAGSARVVSLAKSQGIRILPLRSGDWLSPSKAHDGHGHGHHDLHLWLDPGNAAAMVSEIARTLGKNDRVNAKTYEANAEQMKDLLASLAAELERELAPVKSRPFVVFHDSYQYLESRFGLRAVNAVLIDASRKPSAGTLRKLKDAMKKHGVACVFTEPQFDAKIVTALKGAGVLRTAVLDPLGAEVPDGPALYFSMMRRNAAALKGCLSQAP